MTPREVHIIGAGPAGLTAAVTLARGGVKTVVFEKARDAGARFIGDYQGLENWSTEEDAPDFLASLGVAVNFRCVPYASGVFYGPTLDRFDVSTARTWFYLVERGVGPESLDQGLKRQALEAGAEIRFGHKVTHAEAERVIVATGPRAADAIARGVVFETSHPDACFGFLDDRLAPRAYAYLLIQAGKATLATCLYDDFRNAQTYFERTLTTIRSVVDFDMQSPQTFGGYINFDVRPSWTRGDRLYFVGERAGFQDALWGFGLRYAMLSGYLAAHAILEDKDYDALCRRHIVPRIETSLANRLLFSQLGNHGYLWVLRRLAGLDVMASLRKHHQPSRPKRLLYEIARRQIHPHLRETACRQGSCACLWCEHGKRVNTAAMDRCVAGLTTPPSG
ncbi:NAD(P)/FAD-dependent oxidoreductase [Rhodocaloribacter sp.]